MDKHVVFLPISPHHKEIMAMPQPMKARIGGGTSFIFINNLMFLHNIVVYTLSDGSSPLYQGRVQFPPNFVI